MKTAEAFCEAVFDISKIDLSKYKRSMRKKLISKNGDKNADNGDIVIVQVISNTAAIGRS